MAPLYESVPPQLYGGTERIVSYLTEALVELDHDVTLFASGDSKTDARLVAGCPRALRLAGVTDPLPHHVVMLEEVARRAAEFDLIHYHVDYLHFPLTRRLPIPTLTTLHGRLDLPELAMLYEEFPGMPVVSISDAQRAPLPGIAWQGTVAHGLPRDLHRPTVAPGDYLAFVGRISPEKRVDLAIEIARRAGLPIRIAAKIDRADRAYADEHIVPLLDAPGVTYLGELDERGKGALLAGASALLFPIDWPEPFGLVMIEAMACGTPVVAFARGSVPEVLDDGVSGFVVDDVDAAVAAVGRLGELSRAEVRATFERRFTSTRMACDYLEIYHHQLAARTADGPTGPPRLLDPGDRIAR